MMPFAGCRLAVLPALALAFAAPLAAQAGGDPRAAARDSLLEFDAARRAAAPADVAAWLADDVVLLGERIPLVRGRERIARLLTIGGARSGQRWEPLGAVLSEDASAAMTFGVSARTTATPDSAPVARLDRYVAFWRRTGGGAWRVTAYAAIGTPIDDQGPLAGLPTADTAFTLAPASLPRAAAAAASADADFSSKAGAGIGRAFGAFAAPYATVFGGSEIVVGPAAVARQYAAFDGRVQFTWRPVHADAAASGDLAVTVGRYLIRSVSSGRSVTGKYLTVWQRQPDGRWLFVVDGGTADPAPPAGR